MLDGEEQPDREGQGGERALDAERQQRAVALGQLDGGLSRRLLQLREDLIGLESLIAYDIDFPEEDDGPVPRARIETSIAKMIASLEALLATAPAGELIRDADAAMYEAKAKGRSRTELFHTELHTRTGKHLDEISSRARLAGYRHADPAVGKQGLVYRSPHRASSRDATSGG